MNSDLKREKLLTKLLLRPARGALGVPRLSQEELV